MQFYEIGPQPFDETMLSRDADDATRLEHFLESVLDLLRIGAQSRFLLFGLRVRDRWQVAIESLDEERVRAVFAMLREVPPDARLAPAGVSLENVGLSGPELDAKLAAYADARVRFHHVGGLSNLRRTVRWAKAILGSLTKAIPFAEFILELIEFIENGAADVRDLEQGRL